MRVSDPLGDKMTDEEKTARLEERIAKIEGILEQINERLNHFGAELGDLRKDFRWILGIILTMWVTIIIAVLFA